MENAYPVRELFSRIINFQKSPRTMKWEFGYWGETVSRWYREGLPQKSENGKKLDPREVMRGPSLPAEYDSSGGGDNIDIDIARCFKFDKGLHYAPFRYFYNPAFEEVVISEDEKYIEKYNDFGIKIKELKDKSSMPYWLEFPLKTRADWEKIKEERLRLDDFDSRFNRDKEEFYEEAKDRDYVMGIFGGFGFFGSLRFLMGEERLFTMYYDDPALVHDIAGHLCKLWLSIAEELIPEIEFDLAFFWEDMSGKNGTLISPATFREFMSPYYKKINNFLKSRKIEKSVVDTDGNVEKLIPLFLESGVNMLYPFERQAGNDLVAIRKKYPGLAMMGGFDKNTLFKGKEDIDKEFETMEWLISGGGYIPYCDHLIPPNSSWENFKYYRENLNRIIDNTGVL